MTPVAREAVERLDAIPGVDQRAAQNILAEIGTDMSRFPTAQHLASWAGLCPGNNESAGKRRSGRTTEGDKWLKRTLSQTAWAASRTRGSYFQAQHRRLARRRGPKRATIAVAHAQLCTIHAMLKHGTTYADLGGDHFDRKDTDRLKAQFVHRLQRLGFALTFEGTPPRPPPGQRSAACADRPRARLAGITHPFAVPRYQAVGSTGVAAFRECIHRSTAKNVI